jgi:4-amino-4-deoxy-L-arabinose transferase-like glycosyltransferase
MSKLKEKIKENYLLLLIWAGAFIVRILVAIFSKGFMHADEHFQSIEIAYKRVFGFGVIPWEFEEGVRSWFYPGIVTIIFKIMIFFGITDINTLMIGVRLFSVFCSMIPVVVSYFFAERLFNRNVGIVATIFISFWYDFIFWSARTIGDSLAMNFVFFGCFLVFLCLPRKNCSQQEKLTTKRLFLYSFFAGINFGIAFMFKFSSIVVVIPLVVWLFIYKKWKAVIFLSIGIFVILIAQGVLDQLTWGSFLHSPIEFFKYNIIEGKNAIYGSYPFVAYIALFFDVYSEYSVVFLMFLILGVSCSKKESVLLTTFFFYLLVFSFISHKEYRFILPVMPLLVIFAARGFLKYPKLIKKGSIKKPVLVTMALIALTFSCVNLFYLKTIQPRYQKCLAHEWIGKQTDSEIIIYVGNTKFNSAGYAYLQKNIPLISVPPKQIIFYCYKYQNNKTYFMISEDTYNEGIGFCEQAFTAYNITLAKTFNGTNYRSDTTVFVFSNFVI